MPADDGRDVIIISDLHMSAGRDDRTGTFDRNEDFFYDGAFGRFVDHLIDRARAEERRLRMVILGDFVDFLQVNPGQASGYETGDTSSESTLAKLEIIARGHETVFGALGSFIREGHLLDIVLGNHDVEFVWPDVQEGFRELISGHAGSDVGGSVAYHRWIFYIPGIVYADHGHQYDSRNSFVNPLTPFMPPENDKIELPLGSFFVLYLFNEIERSDPFADNVKPPTLYIRWALRHHPHQALKALRLYPEFFRRVMEKTGPPVANQEAQEKDRRATLQDYARQIELPPATLEEIDQRLARIPTVREEPRQREALLRSAGLGGPLLTAGLRAHRVFTQLRTGDRSSRTQIAEFRPPSTHDEQPDVPSAQSNNYLFATAREIHDLLSKDGQTVPAYVFGHTHNAEQFPIGESEARYLNSGTWTPLIPHRFDLLTTRELFTFVEISRYPWEPEKAVPKLLLWNDFAGRTEPLTRLKLSGQLSGG
jgi:UDP-2,3-diacylglucosamine pyrophosphatase LpxH